MQPIADQRRTKRLTKHLPIAYQCRADETCTQLRRWRKSGLWVSQITNKGARVWYNNMDALRRLFHRLLPAPNAPAQHLKCGKTNRHPGVFVQSNIIDALSHLFHRLPHGPDSVLDALCNLFNSLPLAQTEPPHPMQWSNSDVWANQVAKQSVRIVEPHRRTESPLPQTAPGQNSTGAPLQDEKSSFWEIKLATWALL